jgi:hypothetical protein
MFVTIFSRRNSQREAALLAKSFGYEIRQARRRPGDENTASLGNCRTQILRERSHTARLVSRKAIVGRRAHDANHRLTHSSNRMKP